MVESLKAGVTILDQKASRGTFLSISSLVRSIPLCKRAFFTSSCWKRSKTSCEKSCRVNWGPVAPLYSVSTGATTSGETFHLGSAWFFSNNSLKALSMSFVHSRDRELNHDENKRRSKSYFFPYWTNFVNFHSKLISDKSSVERNVQFLSLSVGVKVYPLRNEASPFSGDPDDERCVAMNVVRAVGGLTVNSFTESSHSDLSIGAEPGSPTSEQET